MAMIIQNSFTVKTSGRGTTEITSRIEELVRKSGLRTGMCHVFLQHTSASLVLCENADPAVRSDLETFLGRLARDGDPIFRHDTEGDDDMPSHVKAALLKTSEQVPIAGGELLLGTWQGLYVWEHRSGSRRRQLAVHVSGE